MTVLAEPLPIAELDASYNWQKVGQEIARKGSQAYDDCILLACQKAPEAFRAEILQSWGIADAALQIVAFAAMQQLEHDDPIRSLSNGQRMALFSQGEIEAPFLFERARELLADGRPASRITSAWANSLVQTKRVEVRHLSGLARRRVGYKSPTEALAEAESTIENLEQELKDKRQQLEDAMQIIVAQEAKIQTLSKDHNND